MCMKNEKQYCLGYEKAVIRPSVQCGFTNVHKDYTQRIITMPHSWKDKLSLKQL